MPIQWEKVSLFDSICKRYVELSKQRVGPVVVGGGDGNGPSTKDSTHQRRARGIVGWQLLTTTKEIFLSNETNKKKIYYSWNNTWKQKERGQSKRVEIQIAWFLTQELICSLYYIILLGHRHSEATRVRKFVPIWHQFEFSPACTPVLADQALYCWLLKIIFWSWYP